MITEFIEDICEELNIKVPAISNDTSKFMSETMLACSDGDTIFIKPFDKPNPDLLFAIAHELRHIWQLKTDEQLYFADYKTVNETDIETYNLQLAEIDANAYASTIMIDYFNLQPLYQGMSSNVVNAIKNRMLII